MTSTPWAAAAPSRRQRRADPHSPRGITLEQNIGKVPKNTEEIGPDVGPAE
jgi:hypothetical protein